MWRKKLIDGRHKSATKWLSHCTNAECGSGSTLSLSWNDQFCLAVVNPSVMELLLFSSTHNKPFQTIFFYLPPLFLLAKGFLSAVKRKHPQKRGWENMPIFSIVNEPEWIKPLEIKGMVKITPWSMHHTLKVRLFGFLPVCVIKENLTENGHKSFNVTPGLCFLFFFPSLVTTDGLITPLCPSGMNQFTCRWFNLVFFFGPWRWRVGNDGGQTVCINVKM